MDYQIALPPDLGLSPADFVSAWNEEPECRTMAEARLADSTSRQYEPFSVGVAVLGSVSVGVATNAIYDWIKKVLTKNKVGKHTKFTLLDQPDGTRVIVVEIVEE